MERLYRLLLRCYPGEFRDEYEREMLQAFRDRLNDDRRHGAGAVLRLLWQVAVDAVVRAPAEHMDVLRQDVRYALRSLRRAPVFFATAVATLALGAGANTAIFSVIHAVALRPLPYDPEGRLIRVWEDNQGLAITGFAVAHPNYLSWKERARSVELAAWRNEATTLRGSGDPVYVAALAVSTSLLPIMGAKPTEGRLFTDEDEATNAPPVAIISTSLWRNQFGGDRSILGKPVKAGDESPVIVGIVPDGSFPSEAEFLTPLRMTPELDDRTNHLSQVIGRIYRSNRRERSWRKSRDSLPWSSPRPTRAGA
jgi:putative ABC transport system permease protein